MLKKLLATTAVLMFVAVASADVAITLVPVDNTAFSIQPAYTYDLTVAISGDDDWTCSNASADVTGGYMWNDIVSLDLNPPVFPTGDTQFTTFYSIPAGYPNAANVVFASFAAGPNEDGPPMTHTDADWFDTTNDGDGTYTIARYTIVPDVDPGWTFHLAGNVVIASTSGQYHPFEFFIPEPSSLVLLALGGLALILLR